MSYSLKASFSCLLLFFFVHVYSQDSLNLSTKATIDFTDAVSKKAEKLDAAIDNHSKKTLKQFRKIEGKVARKLSRIDSVAAKKLFEGSDAAYAALEKKVQHVPYVAKLDTLTTSLKFLEDKLEGSFSPEIKDKVITASSKLKLLQDQLGKAEGIKEFIKARKQLLKEQIYRLGFAKELKQLNKQVYYYSAQLQEYKQVLKDSKKAEKKALELLSNTRLFKDFMRRNSMLASLFRLPGGADDPTAGASLAGLQTRVQVNGLIQQQVSAGGPGAQQQFRDNLSSAQSQLQSLKYKVLKAGGSSSADELPDFKPNQQKTKKFLDRLEYGTNVQTQKANGTFPVTSDLGLSLGYKLNDKSIVGVGSSFKMGWGTGFRDINISAQGIGLRSFIDYKIKGSFWLSGGYEMNYRSRINDIDQLRALSGWQQSGLIGISKVVSLKTKVFKKTKLQLLWDFLGSEQVPRAQTLLFRIGYNF